MRLIPNLFHKIQQTSGVVVGLDPNLDLFSEEFKVSKITSKEDLFKILLDFCLKIIDSTYDLTPAIKLQIAYFEQFGILGLQVLAKVIRHAKSKGLLVIMDAKRGDISDTARAYSKAYLQDNLNLGQGFVLSNEFSSDFLTVNPFLGEDSLESFINMAKEQDKGLFILVKTSNPGSNFLQTQVLANQKTVSENIAKMINDLNQKTIQKNQSYGLIGAVIGATHPQELLKFRKIMPNSLFLTPGVGSQGASIADIKKHYSQNLSGLLIPISRAIIYPNQEIVSKIGFGRAVRQNLLKFVEEAK